MIFQDLKNMVFPAVSLARLCFTHIEPNKSIPVLQNCVLIVSNLWSGRPLIFGSKLFPRFPWHVMHFLIISITKTLPGIIQYFFLRLASKYSDPKWLWLWYSLAIVHKYGSPLAKLFRVSNLRENLHVSINLPLWLTHLYPSMSLNLWIF